MLSDRLKRSVPPVVTTRAGAQGPGGAARSHLQDAFRDRRCAAVGVGAGQDQGRAGAGGRLGQRAGARDVVAEREGRIRAVDLQRGVVDHGARAQGARRGAGTDAQDTG